MKTSLLFALTALALAAARPASATLDFTLQHAAMTADAIRVEKPYITDGPSKIYLQIPGTWSVSSGGDEIICRSDVGSTEVRLGNYHGPAFKVDEPSGQELARRVVSQVPAGAKNMATLPVEYNPFPIFGWTDVQVTVRYEFYGQILRHSVMFINMTPGRVVTLSVTATDAEFDKMYKQARAILSSWFEPSRDLPPDLARKYDAGPESIPN